MMFLLLFTAVALGAVTVVCLPLLRGVPMVEERGQYDRAVYRDQLKEVDRDVARGVLSPAEAGSARLEIQRRLLSVDRSAGGKVWSEASPLLAATVAALVLAGAVGLYLHFGSPSLPDAPFNGRFAQQEGQAAHSQHTDMHQAAQELEQKLQANPSDATGWVLLARTESMLGDWQKATEAYRHAVGLGQNGPDVLAGYGEMQVLAAGGIVSPAAHAAFTAVLAADPKNEAARYYLAVADAQAGEDKRAIDRWLALAADLPEDSPMREAIARGVADAAKDGGIQAPALPKGAALAPEPETTGAQPGPTQDQMAGAAKMSDAQRTQMIQGMVAQLAAHLQQAPGDLDGWLQLRPLLWRAGRHRQVGCGVRAGCRIEAGRRRHQDAGIPGDDRQAAAECPTAALSRDAAAPGCGDRAGSAGGAVVSRHGGRQQRQAGSGAARLDQAVEPAPG